MVAKKAKPEESTPTWGTGATNLGSAAAAAAPMDPGEIPAFLRRSSTEIPAEDAENDTPRQTDLEEFTGSPAPSPTGEQAAPQAAPESPSPEAPAVPPHDPSTGEILEEDAAAEVGDNAEVYNPDDPSNGAPKLGPDTPAAEWQEAAPAATGGDGRELKPDDNQPRTATVNDPVTGTVAGQQLYAFIERVERLEEEKKAAADDIKEMFAEMKGVGFDTKAVRTLIRLRKMDQAKRQEQEAILDTYKAAIGMV